MNDPMDDPEEEKARRALKWTLMLSPLLLAVAAPLFMSIVAEPGYDPVRDKWLFVAAVILTFVVCAALSNITTILVGYGIGNTRVTVCAMILPYLPGFGLLLLALKEPVSLGLWLLPCVLVVTFIVCGAVRSVRRWLCETSGNRTIY